MDQHEASGPTQNSGLFGNPFSAFSDIRSLRSLGSRPGSRQGSSHGSRKGNRPNKRGSRNAESILEEGGITELGQVMKTEKPSIMNRSRMEYAAYIQQQSSVLKTVPETTTKSVNPERRSIREFLPGFENGEEGTHYPHPNPHVPGDEIPEDSTDTLSEKSSRGSWRRRLIFHIFLGMFFTGWWIASLVLHRDDKNWIIPLLLWMAINMRLMTWHIHVGFLLRPIRSLWNNCAAGVVSVVPKKIRLPLSAFLVMAVIIIGSMVSADFEDNTRVNRAVSLGGLAIFLLLLYATSRNRRMINWHTVIVGMLMQFVIAIFVLRTSTGYDIFSFISQLCREFLAFADVGLSFLTSTSVPSLSWFAISITPPIIFFAGMAQLLLYWGVLQWFVKKSATFFFWTLRVSGVEAVVASTSPFLGQGEAVMLIRPFLEHMTNAELHQVMCSGFSTIAGSVLVAFIALGVNGQALISSCVMSIPASLVVSKIRYPEEEEPLTAGYVALAACEPTDGVNWIHAFTNGVWVGLKIAAIVLGVLATMIALVALLDGLLTWWGDYINIRTPLTLELISSYLLYPVAFLLGVPRNGDLLKVSRLIGIKILKNEFAAYEVLQSDPEYATLSSRSRLIATYSLAGFGNIGAMGTQIGMLSQLAPGRSGDVARVALSALITGIISTLLSASMAGILITDQAALFSVQTLNNTVTNIATANSNGTVSG